MPCLFFLLLLPKRTSGPLRRLRRTEKPLVLVSSSFSGQDTPHERKSLDELLKAACHVERLLDLHVTLDGDTLYEASSPVPTGFWTSPLQPCCKNPLNTSEEVQASPFEPRSVPMTWSTKWKNLKKIKALLVTCSVLVTHYCDLQKDS